jgi:hypothetical protein
VASILGAANFLLIPELSKLSFDYLEQNLDHDNFETVIELAEKFSKHSDSKTVTWREMS